VTVRAPAGGTSDRLIVPSPTTRERSFSESKWKSKVVEPVRRFPPSDFTPGSTDTEYAVMGWGISADSKANMRVPYQR
jgi:hypothetical protein